MSVQRKCNTQCETGFLLTLTLASRSVPEVYADIEYTQEGSLISPLKCRTIQPNEVAERGTRPFLEGLSEYDDADE